MRKIHGREVIALRDISIYARITTFIRTKFKLFKIKASVIHMPEQVRVCIDGKVNLGGFSISVIETDLSLFIDQTFRLHGFTKDNHSVEISGTLLKCIRTLFKLTLHYAL